MASTDWSARSASTSRKSPVRSSHVSPLCSEGPSAASARMRSILAVRARSSALVEPDQRRWRRHRAPAEPQRPAWRHGRTGRRSPDAAVGPGRSHRPCARPARADRLRIFRNLCKVASTVLSSTPTTSPIRRSDHPSARSRATTSARCSRVRWRRNRLAARTKATRSSSLAKRTTCFG